MEDTVRILLEILTEERVKRAYLEKELTEEKIRRVEVVNKNLELILERSNPRTPPPTPSFDVHSGLERLPLAPRKRAGKAKRLDSSCEAVWGSDTTCDWSDPKEAHGYDC